MLRSRIIPCLLVHNQGLVKTVKFKDPKYVGDPINAVKIFNEKEVDELMVIDIDATAEGRGPDFEMIRNLAMECRMPFCYGGGITTVEEAHRIIAMGAEKVALSNTAMQNPDILEAIGQKIGMQSVVVILDVKKKSFGGYDVYTHNGKKKVKKKLREIVQDLNQYDIGELVINNMDRDGTMTGYDIKLCEQVRSWCEMPLTFLGGAGTLDHIEELISKFRTVGAAAGSLFVFKGKYRAVLINYPNNTQKTQLLANATNHTRP